MMSEMTLILHPELKIISNDILINRMKISVDEIDYI